MKVATVDIGTNSMRLLIADYEDNEIKNRTKYVEITKMGRNVDEKKRISKDSIKVNSDTLEKFVNMAKKENCEKIKVIGTSALRDSSNKDEFINEAFVRTGVNVEVISGELEANLGFLGVKNILDKKDYTLTIDIGGGSTEFILGDKNGNIVISKSVDVGSVRLTEKFFKSDVPTTTEIDDFNSYMDMVAGETIQILKTYSIGKFIGIGGTATSISSMIQKMEVYSSEKIHNSKIYYEDIIDVYEDLKVKTLQEKKMIIGLQPQRADVIFSGVCILKNIMKNLDIDKIVVSEYDNLEGLIYFMS